MKRKIHNKLIRDNIPEIIKKDKAIPKTFILNDKQFALALKKKLVEEAKKLLKAKTQEEILDELSDVLQLVESIAQNNQMTIKKIEKQKEVKKIKKGGFEKRIFLKWVDKL